MSIDGYNETQKLNVLREEGRNDLGRLITLRATNKRGRLMVMLIAMIVREGRDARIAESMATW